MFSGMWHNLIEAKDFLCIEGRGELNLLFHRKYTKRNINTSLLFMFRLRFFTKQRVRQTAHSCRDAGISFCCCWNWKMNMVCMLQRVNISYNLLRHVNHNDNVVVGHNVMLFMWQFFTIVWTWWCIIPLIIFNHRHFYAFHK